MMHLACIPNMVGGHLGGWRHPSAYADTVMNLDAIIEMVQIAERSLLDCVVVPEPMMERDRSPAAGDGLTPSAHAGWYTGTT